MQTVITIHERGRTEMSMSIFLELPADQEVQITNEDLIAGSDNRLIKKTFRYTNGIVISFLQDFNNNIFSLEVVSTRRTMRIVGNQIFLLDYEN